MCIQEINESGIQQKCENCGFVRDIRFDDLTLGLVQGETIQPDIIRIMPCEGCQSVEFLFVLPEENPKLLGTFAQKHRSLVNDLKDRLEKLGRTAAIAEG